LKNKQIKELDEDKARQAKEHDQEKDQEHNAQVHRLVHQQRNLQDKLLVVLFAWAVLGSLSTPLCLRAGVGHASEL
jgi:hypothetical protein